MWRTKIKVRSSVLILIGIVCFAILVVSARPRKKQTNTNISGPKKPLLVLKKNQPDSPLTIMSVSVHDFPDPRMPIVNFTVKNNSGRRIMAYVIKHEAALGSRGALQGSILFNSPDKKHALRPGASPEDEISGIQYPQPPESLMLSVDFVEFVDGTRWGEDTLKNGERIDGLRAGADAEREALMKVLMTEGSERVISSLDSIEPKAEQSSSRSAEWLEGFRHGVGWVRERVRSKSQNSSDIEKELRRPVDLEEK